MRKLHLKLLAAAMLLSTAAQAQALVNADGVSFTCSDTLSIDDVGGFVVGCTGALQVSGTHADATLGHTTSVTLRATTSLSLDDLRIVSPQIVLDAPQINVSNDTRLDASAAATGTGGGQVTLSAGGDVRLGQGLDPNRLQLDRSAGFVMSVNFQASGSISGARWPSVDPASVFERPAGGVIDITSGVSGAFFDAAGASGNGRFAVPFVSSQAGPVPEPSTWALLLGGLGLMAFVRRRGA